MLSTNIFRYLDEPFYGIYMPEHHHTNRPRKNHIWSTSIPIAGYEPSDVAIKEEKGENGEVKIIIHAKHEKEDDFSEFRKCVKIPKNVDSENLRTIMTKEGLLVLKAPYKDTIDHMVQPLKMKREDTWNGIWGELGRLNDNMNQLIDVHGSFNRPRTEFIADEGADTGTWRLKVNIGKDFKTDEIKLRNHNNQIHLEAKKETKDSDSWSSKYISEVITLPDGIEEDKLRSRLMDNGELIVEAPCKKVPSIGKGDIGQTIPIEFGKSNESDKMAVDS